jgi:hypothetical protein
VGSTRFLNGTGYLALPAAFFIVSDRIQLNYRELIPVGFEIAFKILKPGHNFL